MTPPIHVLTGGFLGVILQDLQFKSLESPSEYGWADGLIISDFSPAFIAAADKFCRGFAESLPFDLPPERERLLDIGANIYLSLSGMGVGFWDSPETEGLQAFLEAYAISRYQFEQLDLYPDDNGKIDLAIMPEFIDDFRAKLFATLELS